MWTTPTARPVITSKFGPREPFRTDAGTMSSANHAGTDYRAPTGTYVRAVGAGRVVKVYTHKARGLEVIIQHGDGTSTLYQHLSRALVVAGAAVAAGDVIGKSGATGATKGAHLHFEAFSTKTGKRFDPEHYLAERVNVKPKPKPAATGHRLGSRELRRGMTGPDVAELQRILNAWYPARPRRPALAEDGSYGPRTEGRVMYLQARAALDMDGIAGRHTLGRLGVKVTF
jgi:hypothetical protein